MDVDMNKLPLVIQKLTALMGILVLVLFKFDNFYT